MDPTMTNSFRKLSLLVAALFAIAGCGDVFQARADEPSLVVSQRIQGEIPGVPAGLAAVVTTLPPYSFSFDMPSTPLTENGASNTAGPLKISSSLQLNEAGMSIPSSYTADFNGFDTVELSISGNGKSQVLARYVKDPAHLPGRTLVLARAEDVEILDYVSSTSRTVTLTISGTGAPPSSNWTADVDMDLKIGAGASWP
jgi:hypothetical protein